MHESTNLRRATIRATLAAGVALGLWVGVIAVGRVWGLGLLADGRNLVLYAPPLLGFYRREPFPDMRIGYVVGALAIIVVPFLARRLPWRAVLVAMPISALVWAVGLAAIDKESGLTHGLGWDNEFGRFVPKIAADPAGFLHGFVANIKFYDIQIRGHPPGFVLVLSLLERVGLQGVGWAAALVIVVGSSAVAAVLLVVRDVAGEAQARRAAPFVAIAPAALWIATSLDAFLLGVTAWSVALIVLAARRSGWRAVAGAIAGGILAGFGLMLSYGMALMVAVIAPLVWSRRDDPGMRRSVAIGTGAAAGVLLAFVPLGFFWPAGLAATREEYKILDVDRPYSYFLIANL